MEQIDPPQRVLDCRDLLERPSPPAAIRQARRNARSIGPSLDASDGSPPTALEVLQMIRAYDANFFGGAILDALRVKQWEVRVHIDRGRGFPKNRVGSYGAIDLLGDELSQKKPILHLCLDVTFPSRFTFGDPTMKPSIAGVACNSAGECMRVQLEHQLVHVVFALACSDTLPTPDPVRECIVLDSIRHTARFRLIAKNVFGLRLDGKGNLHGVSMADAVHEKEEDMRKPRTDLGTFHTMGLKASSLCAHVDFLKRQIGQQVFFYDPRRRRWNDGGILQGMSKYMALVSTLREPFRELLLAPCMVVPTNLELLKFQCPPKEPLERGFYGDAGYGTDMVMLPPPGADEKSTPQRVTLHKIDTTSSDDNIQIVVVPVGRTLEETKHLPDSVTVPEQMLVPRQYYTNRLDDCRKEKEAVLAKRVEEDSEAWKEKFNQAVKLTAFGETS